MFNVLTTMKRDWRDQRQLGKSPGIMTEKAPLMVGSDRSLMCKKYLVFTFPKKKNCSYHLKCDLKIQQMLSTILRNRESNSYL